MEVVMTGIECLLVSLSAESAKMSAGRR